MRLWHKDLIPVLPRQQLLGQWRECCAIAKSIAEKGTPNHVLVNRIMEYPMSHFLFYIDSVVYEMSKRGYKANLLLIEKYFSEEECNGVMDLMRFNPTNAEEVILSGWHNDRYLRQCLANLQEKHDCGAIPEEEWKKIADKYTAWR